MKRLVLVLVVLACAITASFAQSQLGAGGLNGTVLDPQGLAITGATVKVTNTETGLSRTITTSGTGNFTVPVLPPGQYNVRVEKAGFAVLEQKAVTISVGSTSTIKAEMKVGAIGDVVTVTATPLIEVTKSIEASTISETQIMNLPTNGRRYDQFALLAPGVSRDGTYGQLSFHGAPAVFNNMMVEGADDNNYFKGSARGYTRIASNISSDAIQEFQVGTTNLLAESGRAGGGTVNAVVRSGSNTLHGDVFYYYRDQRMMAQDPFATFKPNERRQQLGFSIGGPIKKDKLFYFVNWDQQLRNNPLMIVDSNDYLHSNRPTCANPSACTTAEAQNQKWFDDGSAYMKTHGFPGGVIGGLLPRKANQYTGLAKIDYLLNSNNTLSVTYNRLYNHSPYGIQSGLTYRGMGSMGSDDVRDHTLTARLTSTLSQNMINEFRFSFMKDLGFQVAAESGPNVSVGDLAFGTATYLPRPALPDEQHHQFADNLTITHGSHTFKFGGEMVRVNDNVDNLSYAAGAYSYRNLTDFGHDVDTNGTAKTWTSYYQGFGLPGVKFSLYNWAGFAQDQWRATRRLTLNYGLRYDYEQLPDPQDYSPNPAVPQTQSFNADKRNFSPRISGAYDLFGNGKTVVRAGYGLYYAITPAETISDALRNTGLNDPTKATVRLSLRPSDSASSQLSTFLSVLPSDFLTTYTGSIPSASVSRLSTSLQRPRIQNFNVGVEQQLGTHYKLSMSWVRSLGERLPMKYEAALDASNVKTIDMKWAADPTCTNCSFLTSTVPLAVYSGTRPASNSETRSMGKSWYDAMNVELSRTFAKDFQFQVAYTLAKAEDLTGTGAGFGGAPEVSYGGGSVYDQYNLEANRGRSPQDQLHRLSVNGVWNLPFGKDNSAGWAKLVKDFQLSGIVAAESGRPISAMLGSVPNVTVSMDGVSYSNFSSAPNGQGGLNIAPGLARNSYTGPAVYRTDLRLSRQISLTERMKLKFMVEGFNIFNHDNYTNFSTSAYQVSYSSSTQTYTIKPSTNSSGRWTFMDPSGDNWPPDGTGARRWQLSARFDF